MRLGRAGRTSEGAFEKNRRALVRSLATALLLAGLSAADGFLTLREGGLEIEGNPALRWLMGIDGWMYVFWFHKTFGVGVCGWILSRYRPVLLWVPAVLMAVVFTIHAIVVVVWCGGRV